MSDKTPLSPLDMLHVLGIDVAAISIPEEACFLNEGVCCAYTQLVNTGVLTTEEARKLQQAYDLAKSGGPLATAKSSLLLGRLRLSRARRLADHQQDQHAAELRALVDA